MQADSVAMPCQKLCNSAAGFDVNIATQATNMMNYILHIGNYSQT